jgi:hypothetical protein
MIPVPNLELVIIIPDKVKDTMKISPETELEKSEIQKENEKKKQNRGIVFAVGDDVKFPKKGDYVSFYRAAATEIPVPDSNEVYLSVNQVNVLAKFETHVEN